MMLEAQRRGEPLIYSEEVGFRINTMESLYDGLV